MAEGNSKASYFHIIIWWLCLSIFYLLLIENTQLPDIIAGVFCAVFISLLQFRMQKLGLIIFKLRARWFIYLLKMPGRMFEDCLKVAYILAIRIFKNKKIKGNFYWIPFYVNADHKESVTYRILTTLAVSFLPNSYLIGFEKKRKRILIHELKISEDHSKIPL
jgi:multisubunit Na+/H+ antiporter MnhE subunit